MTRRRFAAATLAAPTLTAVADAGTPHRDDRVVTADAPEEVAVVLPRAYAQQLLVALAVALDPAAGRKRRTRDGRA